MGGGRGGAALSDIWDLVLPRSRTPLWSYTPRCICSWFSKREGDGAKGYTPQNHTRHPQRKTETEREKERAREDEERLIDVDGEKEDVWETIRRI